MMEAPIENDLKAQTEETMSKDMFFEEVGECADRMIEKHGKDFAMGVLILAARFIAEGKQLTRPR
jgi:hypothetical protein